MTQIQLEPDEIIMEKLLSLRCKNQCARPMNYLVFGIGFFCSPCLAKLPDLTEDHFINLDGLSKIIAQMAANYELKLKNDSNLIIFKAEVQSNSKQLKKQRDVVAIDIKSIYEKASTLAEQAHINCEIQHRCESLEAFFSNSQQEIETLCGNIANLHVSRVGAQVSYDFRDSTKRPKESQLEGEAKVRKMLVTVKTAQANMKELMKEFHTEIDMK